MRRARLHRSAALLVAPLLGWGCLGSIERVFDDHLLDAGGSDSTVVEASDVDASDAQSEATPLQDAGPGVGDAASITDATSEGHADAPADGCGATNTVDNCGACGVACDNTTASARICNGASCLYTCTSGRSNCNSAAPDTNGCECATPGCCATGCQTAHSNGVGQQFYDCLDAGTANQTQATLACNAYAAAVAADGGDAGQCQLYGCTGPQGNNVLICTSALVGCYCWKFAGIASTTGHVSTTCLCPTDTDPIWN
jgi:hypothetical protein